LQNAFFRKLFQGFGFGLAVGGIGGSFVTPTNVVVLLMAAIGLSMFLGPEMIDMLRGTA
jgi:hypothetical protein